MKLKLSPSLSYIIGLWSRLKIAKGIGIKGNEEVLAVFAREVLKEGIAPKGLLYTENSVYFYNSKLLRFFKKILEEREDRFMFPNEYACNYFAGIFDAVGEIKSNKICLGRFNKKDALALTRLGFPLSKGKRLCIEGRIPAFIRLIKDCVKIRKDLLKKFK